MSNIVYGVRAHPTEPDKVMWAAWIKGSEYYPQSLALGRPIHSSVNLRVASSAARVRAIIHKAGLSEGFLDGPDELTSIIAQQLTLKPLTRLASINKQGKAITEDELRRRWLHWTNWKNRFESEKFENCKWEIQLEEVTKLHSYLEELSNSNFNFQGLDREALTALTIWKNTLEQLLTMKQELEEHDDTGTATDVMRRLSMKVLANKLLKVKKDALAKVNGCLELCFKSDSAPHN